MDDDRHVIRDCILQANNRNEVDFDLAEAQDFTDLLLDTLNVHFSLVKLPLDHRPYLFALIGARVMTPKEDYPWVAISDPDLAVRLMGDTGRKAGAMRYRIQRFRKGMTTFQETGPRLISILPGGGKAQRDSDGNMILKHGRPAVVPFPTRYRLWFVESALPIVKEHLDKEKTPQLVKRLARLLLAELQWQMKDFNVEIDADRQFRQYRSKVSTYGKKTIDTASLVGRTREEVLALLKDDLELLLTDWQEPTVGG